MYFISACMTSKISQLKFWAHKFERAVLSRLKRISGLGPQIPTSGHRRPQFYHR